MKQLFLAVAAVAATGFGVAAHASTVDFRLTLSGNSNSPTMALANISTAAGAEIDEITMTIGDTSRNFDVIDNLGAPSGGSATLTFGDSAKGGARTDSFTIGFTGFNSGSAASWKTDIDRDNSNTIEDYRLVLFNGTAPNATVQVSFSTGDLLSLTLPDASRVPSYTFTVSGPVGPAAPVPLPASLPLFAGGLGLLGFLGRRRRG